jgi:transcriptional regulator with XRE-family HTH domain
LQHLRAARKSSGVTQNQPAEELGVVRSLIGKIERGERRIDVIELRRICAVLGVSFSDFTRRLDAELLEKWECALLLGNGK